MTALGRVTRCMGRCVGAAPEARTLQYGSVGAALASLALADSGSVAPEMPTHGSAVALPHWTSHTRIVP